MADSVLATSRVSLGLSTAPGAGAPSKNLNLDLETQKESQWCWAAVSVSLARFYTRKRVMEQCKVVQLVRGISTCCSKRCQSKFRS